MENEFSFERNSKPKKYKKFNEDIIILNDDDSIYEDNDVDNSSDDSDDSEDKETHNMFERYDAR